MTTTSFYTLFESAAGYALFSILENEEIGSLLDEVQASMNDLSRFQRIVKMTAFLPFDTAEDALENMNAITEHEITTSLKVFTKVFVATISHFKFYHKLCRIFWNQT
jgi:nucleolar protein 56